MEHFYYSAIQEDILKFYCQNGHTHPRNYAVINGKEVLYTEASDNKIKDHSKRFIDSIYLGTGEWSRHGKSYE